MDISNYTECRLSLLQSVEKLLDIREDLKSKYLAAFPSLPDKLKSALDSLDKHRTRMKSERLYVAFIGGFSAGKSSLVNAILGDYILPEAPEITTTVPTFLQRSANGGNHVEIHYLNKDEIDNLDFMYRKELIAAFNAPSFENMPYQNLISEIDGRASDGENRTLVQYFKNFNNLKNQRKALQNPPVKSASLDEARELIANEKESVFIDRVVLNIACDLPEDVTFVDLPGVSVPNPRHRKVTYHFIEKKAHAVVFVLLALRVFDKDEHEIMQIIRKGDEGVAQKTFWVLNRWDGLTTDEQRQRTDRNFNRAMKDDFGINDYKYFKTNALYGLLAQMRLQDIPIADPRLGNHEIQYRQDLQTRYQGNHHLVLEDSQILELKDSLFDFLNNKIRDVTIQSYVSQLRNNICDPLYQLSTNVKKDYESYLDSRIDKDLKNDIKTQADLKVAESKTLIKENIDAMLTDVIMDKLEKFKNSDELQSVRGHILDTITQGLETDAQQAYIEIVSQPYRKFPYYFEIETKIIDKLNLLVKQKFIEVTKANVSAIFDEFVIKTNAVIESLNRDIEFDRLFQENIDSILDKQGFVTTIRGIVDNYARDLDDILVYKPKSVWTKWLRPLDLCDKLLDIAKVGYDRLHSSQNEIQKEDLHRKTQKIRELLGAHYIEKADKFYNHVLTHLWTAIKDHLIIVRGKLEEMLDDDYKQLLLKRLENELPSQYEEKKKEFNKRCLLVRELLDELNCVNDNISRVRSQVYA
ncbi:MAG: dynamin family protein [Candidatus Omnitrophota bacterium]